MLFGERGIAAWLLHGHAVVCPTIAPGDVDAIAAELALRVIDTVDVPMSGGPALTKRVNKLLDFLKR